MPNPIHFIESLARRRAVIPAGPRPEAPEPSGSTGSDTARAWRNSLRRKIDAARDALREEELDRAARLVRDRLRAVPGPGFSSGHGSHHRTD